MHNICSRTKAKLRNSQLRVAGDLWPIFLYADYSYDTEDPWNGLLRSSLLVSVGSIHSFCFASYLNRTQAYKHVFTSPSSVDQEPKATRSGNARIHGMQVVTKALIAYVATQVSDNLLQVHKMDSRLHRLALHSRLPKHSLGQISPQIQSGFITASSNYSRILTKRTRSISWWDGGTGTW